MQDRISTRLMTAAGALLAGFCIATGVSGIAVADDASNAIVDRKIGFVLYDKHDAVYVTKDMKECPHGFNPGLREQWAILFPEKAGHKYTLQETQLEREGEIWHPGRTPEPYPYYDVEGKISYGLNLDGKVGPNDFTSPDGEKGIDNQMYRATGCIRAYRGPDGFRYNYLQKEMISNDYNRFSIEISDVDSLTNDDDVTVTTYHTRDQVETDATGEFTEGGTQRVDYRWGKKLIARFHGKIVNGVLNTEPGDFYYVDSDIHSNVSNQFMRGARFKLKLTPNHAEGFLGGYVDVERYYLTLQQSFSTSHQTYGALSSPSLYRALHRLADGYPDPKTGANTSISQAVQMKFVQAFILHPPEELNDNKKVASEEAPAREVKVAD